MEKIQVILVQIQILKIQLMKKYMIVNIGKE